MNIATLAVKNVRDRMLQRVKTFTNVAFSKKYLLYTNVTVSLCLSATGDVLEQRLEMLNEETRRWSKKRTFNMGVCGVSVGVLCHFWYNFLDRVLPGYTIRVVAKKIVCDQVLFSPVMWLVFFATLASLEKSDREGFKDNIKRKAVKLYVGEWIVWPPAQFVNFYFVPNRFRVLYDNTISLGFDVYTSNVTHSEKDKRTDS